MPNSESSWDSDYDGEDSDYDGEDIEEFIEEQIEVHGNDVAVDELLAPDTLIRSLERDNGRCFSTCDKNQFRRYWTQKILDFWQEKALASFRSKLPRELDIEVFQKFLQNIDVRDFWQLNVLRNTPLQRLIVTHREDFERTMNLEEQVEVFQEKCRAILAEHNEAIGEEMEFLREFLKYLLEKADTEIIDRFQPIFSLPDHPNKILRQLLNELNETEMRDQSNLIEYAKKLREKKSFYLSRDFVDMVRLYLEPTSIDRYLVNGSNILEFRSSSLTISELLLNERCWEQIAEVHFIAHLSIKFDVDIHLPGINIYVQTQRLMIPETRVIDTSGKNNDHEYERNAGTETNSGNGKDGLDGFAGESAGNVEIDAQSIDHFDHLIVIINGGNGSDGQNGGNGKPGNVGKSMRMSELKTTFPPAGNWGAASLLKIIEVLENQVDEVQEAWCESVNDPSKSVHWEKIRYHYGVTSDNRTDAITLYGTSFYLKIKMKCGKTVTFSWDSNGFVSRCFLVVNGTDGSMGGNRGRPGRGGCGGLAASFKRNGREQPLPAERQKSGEDGLPGLYGEKGADGKNGFDVGWQDWWISGFLGASDWPKYRGANEESKLSLKAYPRDSKEATHCSYYYHLGLDAYVEVCESPVEHLKQTTKETTKSNEREHQHHAKAVSKNNVHVQAAHERSANVFAKVRQMLAIAESQQGLFTSLINTREQQAEVAGELLMNESIHRQVAYFSRVRPRKVSARRGPTLDEQRSPTNPIDSQNAFMLRFFQLTNEIDWNQASIEARYPAHLP